MTQHTKGSHCPQGWVATAGSWWGEACFCDRVKPLNQNSSIWLTQVATQNMAPSIPIPSNQTATITTGTYTWPTGDYVQVYPWIPSPVTYVYTDHHCGHEEVTKNLMELVKYLVDKIVTLEKSKTGSKIGPVKETLEKKI